KPLKRLAGMTNAITAKVAKRREGPGQEQSVVCFAALGALRGYPWYSPSKNKNAADIDRRPRSRSEFHFFFSSIFSPIAVLQPPLPLQLFFPLQPLSLDLQPPSPLQLFLPLQSCLPASFFAVSALPAFGSAAAALARVA